MSWGRWNPLGWGGGRYAEPVPASPVAHSIDDDRDRRQVYYVPTRPAHPSATSPRTPTGRPAPVHDRDDLIIKYKSTQYPLSFRPWSIDDGILLVGDVRNEAARLFKDVSPAAVRLIIKGKRLDDNNMPMRDAGFKSERPEVIFCTVAEGGAFKRPGEAGTSEVEDGEDNGEGSSGEEAEGGAPGKSKKKGKNRKKKRKNKSAGTSGTATPTPGSSSSALPYPTGKSEYLPMPTSAHPAHPAHRAAGGSSAASATSTSASTPPRSASGTTAAPPSVSPSGPPAIQKLDTIASRFHTEIVPKVVQYLNSPPPDRAKKDFERKKWIETIEREVLLKYDAVELEGDSEARARRKECIREAQQMLSKLDVEE